MLGREAARVVLDDEAFGRAIDEADRHYVEVRERGQRSRGRKPPATEAEAIRRIVLGKFCECAVARYLGLPLPQHRGYDQQSRNKEDLVLRVGVRGRLKVGSGLYVYESDDGSLRMVLAYAAPPNPAVTIAGWFQASKAKSAAYKLPPEHPFYPGQYEVPQAKLFPMVTLRTIIAHERATLPIE